MKIKEHNLLHLKLSMSDKEEIDKCILNKSLPDTITILKLEIPPTESFGYYFSYFGIMEILSNVLIMENNTEKHDLRNGDVYLKVFNKTSVLYNLPILCIDVLFFKELSPKTSELLDLKIKTDLLVYTKGGGRVKFISGLELESFYDLLMTPKSISFDLNDEVFNLYSVPNNIRLEIESVFWGIVPIMKLDIRKLYDDPDYSVFEENKVIIEERRTLFYHNL